MKVNLEGKMVIDKKDPNRPRFTLTEMSRVLEERDNVKMRIMELEDELETIRGYDFVLNCLFHVLLCYQ